MVYPIEYYKDYLIKNNLKPSYPRIKVLEYLLKNKIHPTVDQIYSELIKEMPTLSKTTVYNTLNLFTQAKLVRPISIEENEARYDINTCNHGHFKCYKCGEIYDFNMKIEVDSLEILDLKNFEIKEKDIFLKGNCSNCLKN